MRWQWDEESRKGWKPDKLMYLALESVYMNPLP